MPYRWEAVSTEWFGTEKEHPVQRGIWLDKNETQEVSMRSCFRVIRLIVVLIIAMVAINVTAQTPTRNATSSIATLERQANVLYQQKKYLKHLRLIKGQRIEVAPIAKDGLAGCTKAARERCKISRRRSRGIKKQRRREITQQNIVSDICTSTAWGLHKIIHRQCP